MTKVNVLLDLIDNGSLQLPEFQRGYVWNRDQVRGFMRSLYRRYPVGSLLVWQTPVDATLARGKAATGPGYIDLLLDGQQRVTSLYGVFRGAPPQFFEGNEAAFTALHFSLDDETFEFYSAVKMKNNPQWIDVTRLMRDGMGSFIEHLSSLNLGPGLATYLQRLARLDGIKEVDFHRELITGEDKTVDVVVDIFNQVNSGGTKLSKADLALAKICAAWPDARSRLRTALTRWRGAGYSFRIDWLLRIVNAAVTGEAIFTALKDVTSAEFESGLARSEQIIDTLLNNISAHLGLDHDRVLAGRYGFPVMVRYLDRQGGKFTSGEELNKLLYWYVQSFLWGRYVGASETTLNQDLDAVDGGGLDRLIQQLELSRGHLAVRPEDFAGYSLGARFYPMLYLLTRVRGARDWWNGAPALSAAMLGKLSKLQVHHIFPKAQLYAKDYSRGQVNAIANFCYLTQDTNLWVTSREPQEYFAKVEEKYPGALASQWVPMDEQLWSLGRYPDFLEARRVLLAETANEFLDSLLQAPAKALPEPLALTEVIVVGTEADAIDSEVLELVAWLKERGYSEPDLDVEVQDPLTTEALVAAEALWPNGLQEGIGDPVVLELDQLEPETEARLVELGYRVFPSIDSLKRFVETMARERIGEKEEIPA